MVRSIITQERRDCFPGFPWLPGPAVGDIGVVGPYYRRVPPSGKAGSPPSLWVRSANDCVTRTHKAARRAPVLEGGTHKVFGDGTQWPVLPSGATQSRYTSLGALSHDAKCNVDGWCGGLVGGEERGLPVASAGVDSMAAGSCGPRHPNVRCTIGWHPSVSWNCTLSPVLPSGATKGRGYRLRWGTAPAAEVTALRLRLVSGTGRVSPGRSADAGAVPGGQFPEAGGQSRLLNYRPGSEGWPGRACLLSPASSVSPDVL